MKTARFFLFMLVCAFAASTVVRADDQKPIRHLVFNFGVSLDTTRTQHDSGIGGGPVSGSVDSRASNSDTGQIVVDVMGVQPDTGLVVKISEQGRNQRNSTPTMCVTYAMGNVMCENAGDVNEEEYSLLRVLGKDFVNPVLLDSKHHWRTSAQMATNGGAQETNDYTVDSMDGDIYKISFTRVLDANGAQAFNASTQGRITYNVKQSVPTNLTEDTITRKSLGNGDYDTVEQKMSFSLTSDSLAQTKP